MPASDRKRFGNELQDYKMQILGFWCIHIMVSSVSAGSHRTGGLVAQGPLYCLTSHWKAGTNCHCRAFTAPRARGKDVPKDVKGPRSLDVNGFRESGTAVTVIRPCCPLFCCCHSSYQLWLLLPSTPTAARSRPPTLP